MKAKGCLIVVGVVFVVFASLAVFVAPPLLREGKRLYEPIARMSGEQKDFEAWIQSRPFEPPAETAIAADRLDGFLELRRRLAAISKEHPMPEEQFGEPESRPNLTKIQGALQQVETALSLASAAFKEAGMTPAEYAYIERTVYRQWLAPLKEAGNDPAAVRRAARELESHAPRQDPSVAAALRSLSRELLTRRVAPPAGIPAELHAALLERAETIAGLSDVASPLQGRGRVRVRS